MALNKIVVICVGCLLDWIIGDPHWLWHPVQGIGQCIVWIEKGLRIFFHISDQKEEDRTKKIWCGGILVFFVLLFSFFVFGGILWICGKIHPAIQMVVECIFCWQMLAARSLQKESMKVYDALKEGDLEKSRKAVSMIVGRDTSVLDQKGITKAAVETVAENTSDGVIAPLFYMLLFGPMGACLYKTVNTMDSMIGYKNERYLYFGRVAARLDDFVNYIPARISGLFMIFASFLLHLNVKGAWKIYKRDRKKHASPNAAQTEAVCAGALSIRLAGDACYFGKLYKKEFLGDDLRPIETEDIRRACSLMYVTEILVFIVGILIIGLWMVK